VRQSQFRSAVAIGRLEGHDARSIFPSFIIGVFPGENDPLPRNNLAILASDCLLFTITIDEVPTEFSAWSHLTNEVARFDPFRTKPQLQLREISPRGINLARVALMNRLIFSDVFSAAFALMILF
jgi:hypothetical protein